MASIRQRGSKWQARVIRQGFPDETKTFASKAEAEAWARQMEVSVDQGTYKDRRSLEATTMEEVIHRFIKEVCPKRKGNKDEAYRLAALARTKFGKHSLANITPTLMGQWRDDRLKQVQPNTVTRDLAMLSAIFNHCAKEWGYPLDNPVRAIKKPAMTPGRERTLSAEEEARLLQEALPKGRRTPWLHPIIVLALATAMRKGELLALEWQHINLDRRTALLPDTKNGSRRIVPLSPKAIETLQSLPVTTGKVFPIGNAALHLRWKAACRRANLDDIHFHDLRHTAITRMADKLPNVVELSAVTGHKNLQMLKRYYHPNPEALALKLAV